MSAVDSPAVGGGSACRRGLICRDDFAAAADDACLIWGVMAVAALVAGLFFLSLLLGELMFAAAIGVS